MSKLFKKVAFEVLDAKYLTRLKKCMRFNYKILSG